ncbi:acetoin reductase family protein [Pleurotus eryngii]|uniref:Acetoin reductase family protein n=1 Tax=Pleurotus eryngii TaxID=5323 RepID=A0A9P6AAL2_PLEER|nr:acetoin reductase family protein [Pleurotus eryngii]
MSNSSSPSQSNRVAIITGAAQGLGRAIALRLASDGFDVALNDIPAKSTALEELVTEIKAGAGTNSDRRAIFVPGSVADEEDVKELVDRTVRELGGLDVMVSNAGVALNGLIANTSVEDWDALYAVNVRGTFLCYKHAANAMIKQGRGGRIVGACSIAGKKGFPDSSAYSSSKFAVRGLTQSAAQEYGKYGITVNAYAPGSIVTELLGKFDAYNVKKQGLEPGQWTETLKNRAALRKLLTPTDIANLVSFMVSKDASFITGELSTSSTAKV